MFTKFSARLSIYAIAVFVTLVFPLFFALSLVSELYGLLIVLSVAVLFIIETVLFYFWNKRYVTKPVEKVLNASKELLVGKYDAVCDTSIIDDDLTELPKMVNSFGKEFDRLEQMRKTFISNTSHELRSPLTSIQGFLQALTDGTITDNEDKIKYINIAYNETKRLSSLINSMLDLSRLESKKNPVVMTRFDINTVIRQVVLRFERSLLAKKLVLDVDLEREYIFVYADKDKIFQVLVNLIDNAIKYSPPESRIIASTRISGKKVFVSIKDNGYGISQKDQFLIWDRFYMADKARTPSQSKGSGLGLSIVKRIIDDHGESVRLESQQGVGSTFVFSLSLFDAVEHKTPARIIKTLITSSEEGNK